MKPLRPEHIFLAHRDILDFMIESNASLIEDQLAFELWRLYADEKTLSLMPSTLCRVKRCDAGEKILGITPQETVLPCGSFQWDDRRFFLGELDDFENPSFSAHFQRKIDSFYEFLHEVWANCISCEAEKICGFGCLAFILRSKMRSNQDCLPTKMRYTYYQENHTRMVSLFEKLVQRERQKKESGIHIRINELNGRPRIQRVSLT